MRNLFLVLSVILTVNSFSQVEGNYFKKNIAIMDSYLEANSDEESYAGVIVLKDFSESPTYPKGMSYEGVYYEHTRNGKYVSEKNYDNLISKVNRNGGKLQVMKSLFVMDENFEFQEKAQNFAKPKVGGKAEITCDVEFGVCGCYADDWGLCDCCCVGVSNCEVTIGVEF